MVNDIAPLRGGLSKKGSDMLEKREKPEVVSLVALGTSKLDFFNETMTTGNKRGVADEVWVINKMGVIVEHDVLFRMDDLKTRYECNDKRYSGGNAGKDGINIHDTYDQFLREHTKPIITSTAYPEYPSSVEYPLEAVINTIGYSYFRSTPAYAAAFAIHIGVKQLRLYGLDYVYPTDRYKGEAGRANLEFILGVGMAMGMDVFVAAKSTLLDTCIPATERMYGYKDPMDIRPDPANPEMWKVTMRPDVGKKIRDEKIIAEKQTLQELITKYRDEVRDNLIDGKWITKEMIEDREKATRKPVKTKKGKK